MKYLTLLLKGLAAQKKFKFHCAILKLIQLGFIDDLLLFHKGDIQSVIMLYDCYMKFSVVSDFGGVEKATMNQILQLLEFSKSDIPFRHLGFFKRFLRPLNAVLKLQVYAMEQFHISKRYMRLLGVFPKAESGEESKKLKLYSYWRSPCAFRARKPLNLKESLECVRRMRVFGEHNWLQYTAGEVTEMRGHLLKYPVEIDRTEKVKLLHAYGRTVRSVTHFLVKYQNVKIYFVSHDVVKMKDDIKDYLTSMGVYWEESDDLLEVASKCGVITVDVDGDLKAVDLSTSEVSTFQDVKVCDLSYHAALPEVLEILKSACETHGLPLAQT
ncbi:hypothetical protein FXO37_23135 [Capsicum annuum]|nr:hypothetical protein FXO37_23135 [Capsicum annuum]